MIVSEDNCILLCKYTFILHRFGKKKILQQRLSKSATDFLPFTQTEFWIQIYNLVCNLRYNSTLLYCRYMFERWQNIQLKARKACWDFMGSRASNFTGLFSHATTLPPFLPPSTDFCEILLLLLPILLLYLVHSGIF